MTYSVVLKDRARHSISDAINYYETQQKNLGERFLLTVKEYIGVIQNTPYLFPKTTLIYHEAYIHRFPYIIIYAINEDEIVILDVFHTSQHPKKKPPFE